MLNVEMEFMEWKIVFLKWYFTKGILQMYFTNAVSQIVLHK